MITYAIEVKLEHFENMDHLHYMTAVVLQRNAKVDAFEDLRWDTWQI